VFTRFARVLKTYQNRLEQFAVGVLYDRDPPTSGMRAVATLLKGASRVFGLIVRVRFFLYEKRVFHDINLGCKVVVVGNLTVGGTGKTPVTEKMARTLSERGRKVAILSRGYKSRSDSLPRKLLRWFTQGEAPRPHVVSDGKTLLLGSEEAGDEPYMLARNLLPLGVAVLVHRNRVQAGAHALKHFGCDTILLDDGLQYLPLQRQINILLVDKTNPFGNGYLLPRGILREPIRNLSRGSCVFLTKSDGKPDPALLETIRRHNPDAEIIECTHAPRRLSTLDGTTTLPLDYLQGRRVATFSGIATPERFEEFVRRHGGQILHTQRFLDHHQFSEEDLLDVFDDAIASDAELLITTEKDAVRINPDRKWRLPLYYLRLEIDILSGSDAFERVITRICDGPMTALPIAPAAAPPPTA
jgi:tetraacyldisaccharide 4'-kinase